MMTANRTRVRIVRPHVAAKKSCRRRERSSDQESRSNAPIGNVDREARNQLVEANLGLVVNVARKFQGRGMVLEDLIGEGNLGLIRAAEKFDPRFGASFSTYAVYWVRDSIGRALMNTASTIRVPAHVYKLVGRWRRCTRILSRDMGRMPTFDEVASAMELSPRQRSLVARGIDAGRLTLEGSRGGNSETSLSNEVADWHTSDAERLEAKENREALFNRLKHLSDCERFIVTKRYGLEGETLSFKEIGRRLGVCSEWARKLGNRSLNKLELAAPRSTN